MKRLVTVVLILSMVIGGITVTGNRVAEADESLSGYTKVLSHPVRGTLYALQAEEQEPEDIIEKKSLRANYGLEDLGDIMNEQMENYLTGSGSNAAEVVNVTNAGEGIRSEVTFSLSGYHIPYEGNYILQYVYNAIGTYPDLSALYTSIGVSYGSNGINKLIVQSPVSAEEMKTAINQYKRKLNRLIAVPKQNTAMSDMEKLLYVHDELVIRSAYATENINDAIVHTPLALLLEGRGVCQAYAGVMNQAALSLGINSLQLSSTGHAWNAVELDGEWYYLDATFDDPVGDLERDYVSHIHFLFDMEDIKNDSYDVTSHTLDALNQELYGDILNNMGTAYRNLFPKSLWVQMNYLDGSWYYGDGRRIYRWDAQSAGGVVVSSIPAADNRMCAVCDGKLYVSGSDGVSVFQGDELQMLISQPVSNMVIVDGVLNYKTSTGWQSEVLVEEPEETLTPAPVLTATPTPTITPSADPTKTPDQEPAPTLTPDQGTVSASATGNGVLQSGSGGTQSSSTTPGRVTISSLKNKKKTSLTFTFKKVKNAVGYQYCYATNKNFKKGIAKTTKKLSVTVKKLKKKKTYYVRVRAYSLVNGKKKYGKWSKSKKVKIKK